MERLRSIAEARALIAAEIGPPAPQAVNVDDALHRVLAEDVIALHDVPAFANAAMDGFAAAPGPAGRALRLVGESRAGTPYDGPLRPGEAIRISTGALVPAGLAVLQVELTDGARASDGVVLHDALEAGRNVRGAGEDVRRGATVLRRGARLGPAELAVAVNAGRAELRVARRPAVAILATGDELVAPGAPLRPGQVHDSNAIALAALAVLEGATVRRVASAGDTPEATREALADALDGADLVLTSGGVSVGVHDHVRPALEALAVNERFWRVALRPGKPTWFGVRDGTLVLGLPGNPVSAYVTFALFARPALRALQGAAFATPRDEATLTVALPRHPDRDEAVRVALRGAQATPTGPQGSHVTSSLLGADALAIVEAGDGEIAAGSPVAIERLAP